MSDDSSFRLALTGDSIITRRATADQRGPFGRLIEFIRDADLAFTNLEAMPNNFQGYPALESGGPHLGAHPWVIDELLGMGFNLFAAANNHSLNYSIPGLLALIDLLDQKGVVYAGIGRNLAEARMPAYLDHAAGSIALIACCSTFAKGQAAGEQRPDMQGRPGLNPMRYDRIFDVTPERFAAVRAMAEELGIEQIRQNRLAAGFGFPPDDPAIFPFIDYAFREADRSQVRYVPKAKDLDAIAAWVRDARQRADTVVVSLHAHEPDNSVEEPAEFIPVFAKRMIDEGADLVVGHGPHILRGMELYRGRPIFYSLGNFFNQIELTHRLPYETYEHYRADQSLTPSQVFAARSQGDTKGFPGDRRYWETVMPICRFEDGRISEIEIVPVSLGHGEPPRHRGRPRLAEGRLADEILAHFGGLSEALGTRIEVRDGRGWVRLAE